jgi:hypothetical protein
MGKGNQTSFERIETYLKEHYDLRYNIISNDWEYKQKKSLDWIRVSTSAKTSTTNRRKMIPLFVSLMFKGFYEGVFDLFSIIIYGFVFVLKYL